MFVSVGGCQKKKNQGKQQQKINAKQKYKLEKKKVQDLSAEMSTKNENRK